MGKWLINYGWKPNENMLISGVYALCALCCVVLCCVVAVQKHSTSIVLFYKPCLWFSCVEFDFLVVNFFYFLSPTLFISSHIVLYWVYLFSPALALSSSLNFHYIACIAIVSSICQAGKPQNLIQFFFLVFSNNDIKEQNVLKFIYQNVDWYSELYIRTRTYTPWGTGKIS